MAIEARFRVQSKKVTDQEDTAEFELYAAAGNGDWSKWTPSGSVTLLVTNPAAIDWFTDKLGAVVALTFDEVKS